MKAYFCLVLCINMSSVSKFYHNFRKLSLASSSLHFSCLIRYRQPKYLGYTTFIHWFRASLQFLLDLFAANLGGEKLQFLEELQILYQCSSRICS
ncbi:hypothetical protein Avbf_02950 [Armadillidium vulgare]|nr:hypothetical protein Avbf_02950 [Armadillidium vulgare]